MAERDVEVMGLGAAGALRLRLLGSACDGCAGGCAGRCSLFATDEAGQFEMTAPAGMACAPGQHLRLCLDDASLRRAAFRGYGAAWLGLLAGAAVGYGTALVFGIRSDALTLLGLALGTFIAVLSSKRHLPEPHLRHAGSETLPPPKHE